MAGAGINIRRNIYRLVSIMVLLTSLFISSSHAQERVGMFWNYTVDDGLPSNEVYHIHEDSKGYMWFATANGVSRFDGYGFENYSVGEGVTESDIFQIEEDTSGILYLHSISGKIYEGDHKGFQLFAFQHIIDSFQLQHLNSSNLVGGKIIVDTCTNNLVYICQNLSIRFNREGFVDSHINKSSNRQLITKGGISYVMSPGLQYKDKRIVFDSLRTTENIEGFHILNEEGVHEINLPSSRYNNYCKNYISKWNYLVDRDDHYLASIYCKLYYFSSDSLVWEVYKDGDIEILVRLPEGRYIIGYIGNGGLEYYEGLEALRAGRYVRLLNGKSISFFFVDSYFNIWISTTNSGIYRLPFGSLRNEGTSFKHTLKDLKLIESDNANNLFFASNRNDIIGLNNEDGSIRNLIPNNGWRVKYIRYDSLNDRLWLIGRTLAFVDDESLEEIWLFKNSYTFPYLNKFIQEERMSAGLNNFYFNYDTRKIWTTSYGMFCSFDISSLELVDFKFLDPKLPRSRIYSIVEVDDSIVWLGTQHGIFVYDFDSVSYSSNDILDQDVAVYHIEKSTFGLFFGTNGRGVFHHTDSFTYEINESNGLSSNFIESLIAVDSNELWVGTPNGLNRIIFDGIGDYRFQYYSVATGLPSNTISDLEYCNGKIYVATPGGLGIVDPREEIETGPIQPLVSEVLVNNHSYTLKNLKELGSIERNLIIKFDCLDYKQMGNILYRYRMKEGELWNETKERTVNLLRLPPGDYHFEVQARGADRIWSDSETLSFSIASPVWQRYWFWGAVSLSVFGLVFTYTRSRFREVKRQADLQQKVAKLERKALRAQMNPHFIFNVLYSIQGYISEGDTQNAARYVSKFARLIRASLNHSRMTKIPVKEEIQNLKEYLDLENMRMDGQLTYQFHIPEALDSFDYDIPPMLIQPFLENSIKHGIAPKGKGHIDVRIRKINQHLEIHVIDDGIGIEQSRKTNKAAKVGPSLGINIAKERLSVLEGKEMKEHIFVEEIKDEKGQAAGTQVKLLIKTDLED